MQFEMAELPIKYETITVQDPLKPSVQSKVNYLNDVIGNLFSVTHRLRSEQRLLKEMVRLLLHFKHQLAHLRHRDGGIFDQDQLEHDYDACSVRLRRLMQDNARLFEFVAVCEQEQYSKPDQYQPFDSAKIPEANYLDAQYLVNESHGESEKENSEICPTEENLSTEDEPPIKKARRMLPTNLVKQAAADTNGHKTSSTETDTIPEAIEVGFNTFKHFEMPNVSDFFDTVTLKSGQIMYRCKVPDCLHVEYRLPTITSHVFKHFYFKPLYCSSCDYASDGKRQMLRHCQRVHKYSTDLIRLMKFFRAQFNGLTDDYLYQCRFSGCQFETKHTVVLIGHLNWHMSQSPFKCAYCAHRSFELKQMKRHVSRSHRRRIARLKQEERSRCFHSDCTFISPDPTNLQLMIEHMQQKHSFRKKVPRKESDRKLSCYAGRPCQKRPQAAVKDTDTEESSDAESITEAEEEGDEAEEDGNEEEGDEEEGDEEEGDEEEGDEEEDDEEEDDDPEREVEQNDDNVGFTVSYSCSYKNCRFKSKSLTQVRAHEFRRHVKQVLKCSQDGCGTMFNTKAELQEHLLNQHQISGHRCSVSGCGETFPNETRLKYHLRDNHKDVYRSCEVCGKKLKNHSSMRRHFLLHHLAGSYQCPVDECDFVASYRKELNQHRRKDHPRRTKKCTFEGCNAQVPRSFFSIHMRRHLNIKPHVCSWPDCGKSFAQIKSLKDHARIHLNFKRFRCTWPECGYASEQRTNVNKHVRIRHLKLPYTKKQERELNIDYDSLPQKSSDFIEVLPEDARVLL